MKKITFITLTLLLFACNNAAERVYEKNSEGNFQFEEQVNDSVVKRVVLDSNRILSSVEYENTKKQSVVIFYYKNGKLDQSLKMNTNGIGFIENCVYSGNGKVLKKLIKTQDNEEIASFDYRNDGKLSKKRFFRTGRTDINSLVSYDSKGLPLLKKRNSHFLYVSKEGSDLVLKPAELGSKPFIAASVFVVDSFKNSKFNIDAIDGYKRNPNQYPSVLKRFDYGTNSRIHINMNELDLTKGLKCKIFINDIVENGAPNFIFYELYIPNLDSIPSTNLYPIVE